MRGKSQRGMFSHLFQSQTCVCPPCFQMNSITLVCWRVPNFTSCLHYATNLVPHFVSRWNSPAAREEDKDGTEEACARPHSLQKGLSVDTPAEAVTLWLPKTPASQLCSPVSAHDCLLSWPAAPMACASSLCHFHSHAVVLLSAPKSFSCFVFAPPVKNLVSAFRLCVCGGKLSVLAWHCGQQHCFASLCGCKREHCALPLCSNRNLRAVAILFGGHELGVGVQSKPSLASPLKLFMGSSPDGCMR